MTGVHDAAYDSLLCDRGQVRLRDTFLKAHRPPEPPATQLLGFAQGSLDKRIILTDRLREALDSKVNIRFPYRIAGHDCICIQILHDANALGVFIVKSKQLTVPALKPLMEAIWTAEIRGMFRYYRIAVVLLADIGINLNLSHTGLAWIEEIFPQVRRTTLWAGP